MKKYLLTIAFGLISLNIAASEESLIKFPEPTPKTCLEKLIECFTGRTETAVAEDESPQRPGKRTLYKGSVPTRINSGDIR